MEQQGPVSRGPRGEQGAFPSLAPKVPRAFSSKARRACNQNLTMAYGSIKWEPWVVVLKDEKKRTVEVVRFDNFEDMMIWKKSEEGVAVHNMQFLTVVSMTERYYLQLYSYEQEVWWNEVEHLIKKL